MSLNVLECPWDRVYIGIIEKWVKDSRPDNQWQPVANFTHFLILNPDDFMQGTNEPKGTQLSGARDVWYIKPPDTFAGVFLFVENNAYQEDGG